MSSIGVLPRCEFSSILVIRRGGSSVGRALRSQCRGRGFDSLPLHWHNPTMLMHRWVFLCAPAGDPEGPEENDRTRGKADPIGGSPRISPPLPAREQSRGSRRQRGWSGASTQEAITAKMLPPVLGWNPVPVCPSGGWDGAVPRPTQVGQTALWPGNGDWPYGCQTRFRLTVYKGGCRVRDWLDGGAVPATEEWARPPGARSACGHRRTRSSADRGPARHQPEPCRAPPVVVQQAKSCGHPTKVSLVS
jgi:hypothetical protein